MSQTPFMPLWVSDFLGDTLDLEACEIGAYMLLLMAQWNRDGESLPNDPKKLQRVARCGRNWKSVWGNIERYFETDEKGVYNKRLRLEAQNVATKRSTNSRNGALGGKAKALKNNNVGLANATETLERNAGIPEPEPYKIDDDDSASAKSGLTFREKILAAMQLDGTGVLPSGSMIVGTQGDMAFAAQWLELPRMDEAACIEVVREVMARKQDGHPSSFKYFNSAMQARAGQLAAPKLKAIPSNGSHRPQGIDQATIIQSAAAGTTQNSQEWTS